MAKEEREVENGESKDKDGAWRHALRFSAVGLEMGVAVAIGYGAGWWLDETFGTKPYLTLVMLLLGIAAAFLGLIRAARAFSRRMNDSGDD
jgi:ATP synthase protein I